jgi:hypothetical protein
MVDEPPIDATKDAVLVMRDSEGKQDFFMILPPFKGDNKKFPAHIGTAVTIAACLYEQDEEFHKLITAKFDQYAKEYLDRVCSDEAKQEEE